LVLTTEILICEGDLLGQTAYELRSLHFAATGTIYMRSAPG
jgi:hypothetical protein